MIRRYHLAVLVVLTVPLTGWAESRHVDPSGDDANAGTETKPWKTLQHAIDQLNPGDVLLVRAGNYPEHVRINRSGEKDRPITIKARANDLVTLDPGSFTAVDQSHLRLEGYVIMNTNDDRPAIEFSGSGGFIEIVRNEITGLVSENAAALRVGGTLHDFRIEGNHVHHNSTGAQEAIRVHESTRDFVVTQNEVNHNSNIGIDIVGWARFGKAKNGIVSYNRTHHNGNAEEGRWVTGIYLDGPDSIIVEHNISYANGFGYQLACEPSDDRSGGHVFRYNIAYDNREYGLAIGGYTGGEVHHCLVHNNVFANNQREIGFSKNAGHHHQLFNNILYNPTGQSINYLSQPTETVIDSNCYHTRYGDRPGANSITGDPQFVNAAAHDFRLNSSSPCLQAGQPVPETGNTRSASASREAIPNIGSWQTAPHPSSP